MIEELLFVLTVLSGKVLSQSSCRGYCGQSSVFWSCNCDVDCATGGDCCYDYHNVCEPTTLYNYKIVAGVSRDVNIGSYSFAECKSLCVSDSGCYYLTFISYRSQCYTYDTYNSLQYDSSAISVSYAGRFKTTTTTPAPTTTTTAVPTAPPGCYVSHPAWLGDKDCDHTYSVYNTEECEWDGGDCCKETNSQISDNVYCKNPVYSTTTTTTTTPAPTTTTAIDCYVSNPEWLGDKECDHTYTGYNTEECQWDGGDCCKETNSHLTNNYHCRDPSYSTTTTAAASTTTAATLTANASKSKSSMIEGVTTGLVWIIIIIVVVVVIVLSVLLVLYFRKRARKGMEQTFYVQMVDTPQ